MKMYEPLKILSDGDKIVIVADGKCYALEGGIVSSFDYRIDRAMQEVASFGNDFTEMIAGPVSTLVNLTIQGSMLSISDKTDIIDQQKVKEFTKQINQEVKQIALKRSLEF